MFIWSVNFGAFAFFSTYTKVSIHSTRISIANSKYCNAKISLVKGSSTVFSRIKIANDVFVKIATIAPVQC